MNKKVYLEYFKGKSSEGIVQHFLDTIIDTNRSYKFFVDWNKIKRNISKYKIELNIMNSLIGSTQFNKDLRAILKKYPEVLPVIPLLIAVRETRFKVVRNFIDGGKDIVDCDFASQKLSKEKMNIVMEFFEETGLKLFFETISSKSIQDYVTGVEVGMDTHARKNRSGNAMELAIRPILEQILEKSISGAKYLFQKKFGCLESMGCRVPIPLKERKSDFIVLKKDKVINIEVNFYSGTGSKPQEIVDSYINRQNELREYNIHFIWITDGNGWRGQKHQIDKGFDKMDYVLNLHFCRHGLLENILRKI
jgi:type II restriction enzyme